MTLPADQDAADQDSLLDRVSVAAPCSADWGAMDGDARVRHCGQCEKNVYNLSSMTSSQRD